MCVCVCVCVCVLLCARTTRDYLYLTGAVVVGPVVLLDSGVVGG